MAGWYELDEDAYARDDPKHPGFAEAMLDWADDERKRRKEQGPVWCVRCGKAEPARALGLLCALCASLGRRGSR